MNASEVMSWLNNGLAVVLLVGACAAGWRICSWAGKNVVIPLKDAAIGHLAETNKTMAANAEATGALTTTISALHTDVKDIKIKLGVGCKFHHDHIKSEHAFRGQADSEQ